MEELKYNIINTDQELDIFIDNLNNQHQFVFDLESSGLETHSADIKIVGIGFCWEVGVAYYIPFNKTIDQEKILEKLILPFLNDSIGKIGHNLKFDIRLLDRFGIKVNNILFDTCVAGYSLYGDRLNHNLDDLTLHHLNHVKIRTKSLIPKKSATNPNPSMLDSPADEVGLYCCEDVDFTFRLFELFRTLLALPENLHCKKLFYEIDMPLVPVLIKMECQGVKIDETRLETLRTELSALMDTIHQEIDTIAGRAVVLTNPSDIGNLVFIEKGLGGRDTEIVRTATGRIATTAATLEALEGEPLVDKILEYKTLNKLMSTYILAMPGYISKHTGLLHPFFNQTGTSTGRLSSSSPNVQNIPAKNKIGKQIREAFISRFLGGFVLSVDYNQAELRILAHMSKEPVFLKAYKNNEDIHTAVAAEVIYNKPKDQVTKEERTPVKVINFGLMYGMRGKRLAATLGIGIPEANALLTKYMNKMGNLRKFLDEVRVNAAKTGYSEGLFGRRRYVPKIFSNNQLHRWSAEREAANNVIQNTNADIIRIAMVRVQDMIDKHKFKSMMILQVHDELVFDIHPEELETIVPKIVIIMESIVKFDVIMKAEAKYAKNWSDAH